MLRRIYFSFFLVSSCSKSWICEFLNFMNEKQLIFYSLVAYYTSVQYINYASHTVNNGCSRKKYENVMLMLLLLFLMSNRFCFFFVFIRNTSFKWNFPFHMKIMIFFSYFWFWSFYVLQFRLNNPFIRRFQYNWAHIIILFRLQFVEHASSTQKRKTETKTHNTKCIFSLMAFWCTLRYFTYKRCATVKGVNHLKHFFFWSFSLLFRMRCGNWL